MGFQRVNWTTFTFSKFRLHPPHSLMGKALAYLWFESLLIYQLSHNGAPNRGTRQQVKLKVTESCLTLCDPMDPWNSPGQNTGVGSYSLLQDIFPTHELNPGLPHCRQILSQLSHEGSPRILEWIAYPFPRGSSQPRNRTRVSSTAGDYLPTEWSGKP